MNKKQIISRMVEQGHFETKKAAGECLNDILTNIENTVAAGTDVRIAGFGKFEQYIRINGSKTPKFRPFAALKTKVA